MEEEKIYKLLYKIRHIKERYDEKIGMLFHDICVCGADYVEKGLPIQMDSGMSYVLMFSEFSKLLYNVCGIRIQKKHTAYCSEILTRELGSLFKCSFYECFKEDGDLKRMPADILEYLIRNSFRYMEQRLADKKHFEEKADSAFNKEEIRTVISPDGFKVEYKVFGRRNLNTIIVMNAYGIPLEIWKYLIHHYSREYKVIVWDTRGSKKEHCNVDLQPVVHNWDLESILIQENVTKADWICWCSGLKILAEFYNYNPQAAKSIVIVSGYFNPIPAQESYWTEFDKSIGKISQMIVKDKTLSENPLILGLIQKLFQFDIGEKRLETLRTDGRDKNERYSIQYELARNPLPEVKSLITAPFYQSQTLYNYAKMTIELQKHEILPLLSCISIPTLIINAGMDMVTDLRCAKAGQAFIKSSRLVELPNATHWCIWEDYDQVAFVIDKFWKETRRSSISS